MKLAVLRKGRTNPNFNWAAGYIDKARKIGSIIVETKNSHKFDILLNDHLRKALKIKSPHGIVKYEPTKNEIPLFDDLTQLAEKPMSCDLDGLRSYWKATRNRRYAQTIFQQINLFEMAGRNIQQDGCT